MSDSNHNPTETTEYNPFDGPMGYGLAPDPETLTPEQEEKRQFFIRLKKLILDRNTEDLWIWELLQAIFDYDLAYGNLGQEYHEVQLNKVFYKTILQRVVSQEIQDLPELQLDALLDFHLEVFHHLNLKAFIQELRTLEAAERDAAALEELRKTFLGALHTHGIDPRGDWRIEPLLTRLKRIAERKGLEF